MVPSNRLSNANPRWSSTTLPCNGPEIVPYVSTKVRLEKTRGYKEVATVEGNPRQLVRGIA